MKKLILILTAIITITACQQKKYGAFTVSGKIDHAPGKHIFLQELPFNGQQPVVLDSGTLKTNGIFELRGMGKEEGLYRLVIENGPDVLMVNDSEARQLSGEFSLVKSAKKILDMGPKYLIIIKGEHGA